MKKTEHAFVLSGGGATGAYEIGVMRALFQEGCDHVGGRKLDPGIYTGTSVGAFNAAFMASPEDREAAAATNERLQEVWIDKIAEGPNGCGNGVFRIRGNVLPYLNPACWLRNPTKPLAEAWSDGAVLTTDFWKHLAQFSRAEDEPFLERLLELGDVSAFISPKPMEDLVRSQIDLLRLRASKKKLRIVASDWLRGDPFVFAKDDMTDEDGHNVVLASAAIPAVFPPVRIGDNVFVDGGVTMNTPLKPAIEAWREDAGKDEHLVLHVIYLDTKIEEIPLEKVPSTFATTNRLLLIGLAHNMSNDIEYAGKLNRQIAELGTAKPAALAEKRPVTIHRYRPKSDLSGVLGLLDFRRKRIERLIELGYEDAVAHDCEKEECLLAET